MTIDEVDRLVRHANPVPDPTMLDAVELDAGVGAFDDVVLDGAEVVLIDTKRTPEERARRRRGLVVAAAVVAALVLVAASFVVRVVTDDDAQTEVPTDPGPNPTTAPAPTGGADELPPPGATPSTPERGELVASIATWGPGFPGDGSFYLFADGRLMRLGLGSSLLSDVPGVVEQRLTAEGVELVRSEFLATGLFGPGPRATSSEVFDGCACIIQVLDRGGQLLSTEQTLPPSPERHDPEVARQVAHQVDRLIEYVIGLDSSLSPSAWEDRDFRAYVPSRYRVCMTPEPDAEDGQPPAPDLFALLTQRVTAPVPRVLARARPTTESGSCIDVTTGDARQLADALDDASVPHAASGPLYLQYVFYEQEPAGIAVTIDITGLLPDLLPHPYG